MLALMLACSEPPTPPAAARPDIVLVVIDTLRADHLGSYGSARPTSPNIDAMAAEGLRFHRAYAHSGWTLPSFTSLFTGLLPHEHRVGRSPTDSSRFGRLPAERVTLAESLTAAGYATAAVMNNTFLAPDFGLKQGFGDSYLWQGASNAEHRSAEETTSVALSWLSAQDTPAFLVVHMMEPHLDYGAPAWARGRFTPETGLPFSVPLSEPALKAGVAAGQIDPAQHRPLITGLYDEEILAADRAVGMLREGIAATGRPTLTVLTADHGEEFWDHGGFEHGHSLYGELTRVPLIVTGPGIPVGEVKTVVSHQDLYQAIIKQAGAQPAEGTRGDDLLEIAGEGVLVPGRVVLSENTLYGAAKVSLVDDTHRLVINQFTGAGEVWEVAGDASELVRLQGKAQTAAAQQLVSQLQDLRGGSLELVDEVAGPHIPDSETFQMLKSLGYTEE